MVDALSRKKVIAYINALSKVISDFNERIKHTAKHDATYGRLRQQVKEGVIRRHWLEGDLLVGKMGNMRSSTTGMNPFELAIGVQPRMPLEVAKQKVAYMLKLLERLKLHPTFHVSFLKTYHEDLDGERLIWPDGAFLGGHVSIPDWLSWNQNSVFESQSEIDTWQGGICKSCRLLRGRGSCREVVRSAAVRDIFLEEIS
uniref:Uncharacterized protein n=1 Tax=Vitis vinifera TaxID=29760 RepID=A5C2A4_VITVI|nr:hypothetical protein VITISV_018183 [Vitis vinifera]